MLDGISLCAIFPFGEWIFPATSDKNVSRMEKCKITQPIRRRRRERFGVKISYRGVTIFLSMRN